MAKGWKPEKGRHTQDHVRKSLGFPAGEESADERWRSAGKGSVQIDSRSAPRQDEGGEAGEKI